MARPRRNQSMPGLYRVPKDESKPLRYWQASVEVARVDGVRQPRKTRYSKDWDTAYRYLREMEKDLEENPEMTSRTVTVAEWADKWFAETRSKQARPKTLNNERSQFDKHIRPVIGTVKLDRLRADDLTRVLNKMADENGLSSTSARHAYRLMSTMFKAAARVGMMRSNPADRMDAPRKAHTELLALTEVQAFELIRSARDSGDRLWTLWAAVLITGARQGELLGLEVDRVSDHLDLSWQLQRLTWQHGCGGECGRKRGSDCLKRRLDAPADWKRRHVTGGLWLCDPKTSKATRAIPLTYPLRPIIEQHLEDTANEPNPFGLVWRMPNGNPIDPAYQGRAWRAALERAGLPRIRLHDGRHSAVDLLYASNVPEDLILEIVGHSSRSTSRNYKTTAISPRKIAAMEAVGSKFTRLLESTPQAIGE